jgi:hypothetical protein
MRILVAGWFSFEHGTATAGDVLARDLVCEWLGQVGHAYDVATAAPFTGGVDIQTVDPERYTHLVFVCGPFERGRLERVLLSRFWSCRLIGLDLSMQVPLGDWNPFDLLIERDSSRAAHPDLVFATRQALPPVVGVCLVEPYPAGATDVTDPAVRRLTASRAMAVVEIDTRLDRNTTGFRTPGEVEAIVARLDVMITTRLHGMVLALKNGVPAIVIDPERGGNKLRRQAAVIEWPVIFDAGALTDAALGDAFGYCLRGEAREAARRCSERAAAAVHRLGEAMLAALADGEEIDREHRRRLGEAPEFVDWELPARPPKPDPADPPRPRRWFRR